MEVEPLESQIKTEVIHTEIELKVETEDFYIGEIPESDPNAYDFELAELEQVADETTLEGSSNSTVSQVCILCRQGTIECEKNEIVVHCRPCQKNLREKKKNLFLMKIKQLYKSCLICVNVFYNNLPYKRHDCTLEGAFVCDGCCRIFVEKENLIVHINKCKKIIRKINNNESDDNAASESKSELKLQNYESIVGLNKSGDVDKMATSTGRARMSVRKCFSCSMCEKRFSFRSWLIRHLRTHTGEKPFACMFCNRKFSHTGHLNKHLRKHFGEESYSCEICAKSFCERTSLKNHLRVHTGERPYHCNSCDKTFNRADSLKEHWHVHSREKLYFCKVCDKNFPASRYLARHLRIHTGERPYNCNVCDKCFARADTLRSHMRLHTGDTPYKCKLCDKKYTHGSSLKIHLLVHKRKKL